MPYEKRSHQKLLYHSRLDQQQARTSPFHGLRFHTAPTCTFSCRKEHSVLFYTTNKQLAKLGIFLQMAKWVKALSTLLKIARVCVCIISEKTFWCWTVILKYASTASCDVFRKKKKELDYKYFIFQYVPKSCSTDSRGPWSIDPDTLCSCQTVFCLLATSMLRVFFSAELPASAHNM